MTSQATLDLKTSATSIDLYARNMRQVPEASFKLTLSAEAAKFEFVEIIYGVIAFLFLITLCAVCVIGCMRCWSKTPVQSDRRRGPNR